MFSSMFFQYICLSSIFQYLPGYSSIGSHPVRTRGGKNNKNSISKFNVSQKIIVEKDVDFTLANTIKTTDQYTYFRIVTYNYPIRFDSQSKYFLFFLNEKTSEKCKALDKGKYLKLLIC